MQLIDKALRFAAEAHEGQYRKGTKTPYITHPVAVGMLLLKHGYSEELVAAGILHDTVEDTDATLEDIETRFGRNVAEVVAGCSEPDKTLSWEERKEHTIELLKTTSNEIRAVACADKLHNISSILDDVEQGGDEVWSRFNRGRDKQEWYYRSLIDSLGSQGPFPLLEELKTAVQTAFSQK
ncbi:HD domain-containing protein [Neobacillus sp. YIM B06451]|uniref:HD domain-containing protein n=1 Tax=Neobacillus sp. YIM B06451 TaxID=3070994 RepID=UPI00292FA896|nr:HD domain-containing protein [Neobacillus sp. YIM B06451]